jgi:hypothetical protein
MVRISWSKIVLWCIFPCSMGVDAAVSSSEWLIVPTIGRASWHKSLPCLLFNFVLHNLLIQLAGFSWFSLLTLFCWNIVLCQWCLLLGSILWGNTIFLCVFTLRDGFKCYLWFMFLIHLILHFGSQLAFTTWHSLHL